MPQLNVLSLPQPIREPGAPTLLSPCRAQLGLGPNPAWDPTRPGAKGRGAQAVLPGLRMGSTRSG